MINKKIKARVCKGFITRFNKEEEWDEWLIPFDEKELVDGDAVSYYLLSEDGKYREYYGNTAPEGKQVYVVSPVVKIKIYMEAEVDDLKTFYPNDPEGVTIANVADHLHEMLVSHILSASLSTSSEGPIAEAIKNIKNDEFQLGERLLRSLKIELE